MNHGYLPVIAGQPLNLMMQGVARAGRMLGGGAAGRQPAIGKTQLLHRCGQRLPAIVDQQSGAQITPAARLRGDRSEEHTSELQSLMRTSYAVFCLKKKNNITKYNKHKE